MSFWIEKGMVLRQAGARAPDVTRRTFFFTIDARRVRRTPQGGLRIPARVSKAGVFQYQRGRESVREYRPPEELKRALATAKGAPVVILHPDGDLVTPDNARTLQVGHFEDPWWNEAEQAIDGFVVTNDAETIRRIESGELADISSGCENLRQYTPGKTERGEQYDLVQTNHTFNHIALGPPGWGRQGSDVGLTLDARDNQQGPSMINSSTLVGVPKHSIAKVGTTAPSRSAPPAPGDDGAPRELGSEELVPDELKAVREMLAMLPKLREVMNAYRPEGGGSAATPPVERTTDGGAEPLPPGALAYGVPLEQPLDANGEPLPPGYQVYGHRVYAR